MRTLTSEQAEMRHAIEEIEACARGLAAAEKRFRTAREALFEQQRSPGARASQTQLAAQLPVSDERLSQLIVGRLFALGLVDVANGRPSRHRAPVGPEWQEQMSTAIEALGFEEPSGQPSSAAHRSGATPRQGEVVIGQPKRAGR
jgi:hypothetical protein